MENISVNKLVESTNSNLPRDIKIEFAKNILSSIKNPDDAKKEFKESINRLSLKKQREIINATGTVLHTNLGRSPVDISFSGMYTNIEYDLTTASRGNRNDYLTESMKVLLNAENVAFVNNNASSLYLSLLCLAKKHNKDTVIVSRGEIIEIGGSYRLPDIIFETGMNLIEVGTTNKTRLSDYEGALKENPNSIVLKVHRSNFSITGFTEEVGITELVDLKNKYDTLLIHDLGSGLVIENSFLSKHNLSIFENEPRVQQSIKDGVDIVMFSGDKLFGSVQSGIIAGKNELINSIKKFSIFRTYRCSDIVLYELQKTTELYIQKNEENIPFWNLLKNTYSDLENRFGKIIEKSNVNHKIINGESLIGGGTLPNITLSSPVMVLDIDESENVLMKLINNEYPIIPRVVDGKINIDLRSVFENQDDEIAKFLNSL
jgi:L-seryl-tRNA(Ser) seleniumtransferase